MASDRFCQLIDHVAACSEAEPSPANLPTPDDQILNDTLDAIAAQALTALDAERSAVWLVNEANGAVTARAWRGLSPVESDRLRELELDPQALPLLRQALALAPDTALTIDDAVQAGVETTLLAGFSRESFIVAPIAGAGGVFGLLYADQRSTLRAWTDADRRLAAALAGQAAVALTTARRYTAERRRAERAEALRAIERDLTAELTLEQRLRVLQRQLERLTGLDNWSVSLWDAATNQLDVLMWIEEGQRRPEAELHGPMPFSLTRLVMERGTPLVTTDFAAECARHGIQPPNADVGRPGRAWLGLPLLAEGRAIGALVAWRWHEPIPTETVEILELLAGQIATVLEHSRLYEETERRRQEEVAFNAIAHDLAASFDSSDALLQRIADHTRTLLDSSQARILLYDGATDTLQPAATAGYTGQLVPTFAIAPSDGVTGYIWRTGKSLVVDDYLTDTRFIHNRVLDQSLADAQVRAALGTPVALGEQRRGVLMVNRSKERPYTARDEATLARLATQVALAVRNAQLYADAHERAARLEVLNETGRALGAEIDLDRLLTVAWRQLGRVARIDGCWLALWNEAANALDYRLYGEEGVRRPEWETPIALDEGKGLASAILQEGRPIRVADYGAECRRRGLIPNGSAVSHPNFAWLGIPLLVNGRTIGATAVWRWEQPFQREEAAALETLSGQIAAALENARLYHEARQLARTDPLTGLLNHRTLHERLDEELTRAIRYNHPLAVVMLDLDNFKRFNDTYGHPTGDKILGLVAAALRAAARSSDFLGRYGGDEFMLALPETDLAGALTLVKRAHKLLARAAKSLPESAETPVTMSAGIAVYPDDTAVRQELIALADKALYAAKRGGQQPIAAR
ncbi:MAG: GAF domain-containing protein [Thermomicrobiales bacterium]